MKLAALALLASPGLAEADSSRCASTEADLTYSAQVLPTLTGDTGWFPGGSPAQLKITGKLVGETTIAMGLAPSACWDNAMTMTAPGRAKTGLLDSQYGAEVHVFGQIHTSVLGVAIDRSGEIPVPFVPNDLALTGTTAFDPVALPGSAQPVISVSDTTSKIPVISTNVLSSIIPISGISGGLTIYVQGQMTTSYATQSIQLGDGAITSASGSVAATQPAAGYGATLEAPLYAHGTLTYAPSLIFDAAFTVKILGITVVSWDIASIGLPLPTIDRAVDLTGNGVSFALPHLANVPETLGFATGATQTLTLHNGGTAPLVVTPTAPAGTTAAPATIAPGADGTLTVTASDATTVGGALVLATNDPNHPELSVTLDPAAHGQIDGDPAQGVQHGGCSSTGSATLWPMLALVGLLRRRRR